MGDPVSLNVAILTQPLKHNYGGMLQAFALQKILNRLGHRAVTIDRQPDRFPISNLRGYALKKWLRNALRFGKDDHRRFKYTLEFVERNIALTEPINSTYSLAAEFRARSFDAVIVGSDQTWRPRYSPNIYNYYLDFLVGVPIRKVAYASSFGVDNWEYSPRQTWTCSKLAKNFDAISVRERSAVGLCRDHLGVKATCVLDPTLMLEPIEYLSLAGEQNSSPTADGTRIFAFLLDKTDEKLETCRYLAQEKNGARSLHFWDFECKEAVHGLMPVMPSMEFWIRSFSSADFVITDSYHGCVMSILLQKQFVVIGNSDRGLERFSSLLGVLGLEGRMINNSRMIDADYFGGAIDWEGVQELLAYERGNSLKFLQQSLNDD